MGSSIIFVGLSMITFIISFGIMFNFMPVVLGSVYTTLDEQIATFGIDPEWQNVYGEVNSLSQYLVPLVMSLALVLFIMKILMIAGVRGGD